MKIIELLNKIANDEELPTKIYCFNREFYLKENTYFGDTFTLMHYIQEEDLNNEVEIIEEEKKIPEKLKSLNNVGNVSNLVEFEDKQQLNNHLLKDKLNEIIHYLQYLKSKEE